MASKISKAFSAMVSKAPSGFIYMLSAVESAISDSYEIVIVIDDGHENTEKLLSTLRKHYIPNKVVIVKENSKEKGERLSYVAPFTEALGTIDGKPTAYVCKNYACEKPVTDVKAFEDLLGKL